MKTIRSKIKSEDRNTVFSAFWKCTTRDALEQTALAHGIQFTSEELDFLVKQSHDKTEISDDELNSVSAGCGGTGSYH